MNKVELIEHIAAGADISTLAAEQVLNSLSVASTILGIGALMVMVS